MDKKNQSRRMQPIRYSSRRWARRSRAAQSQFRTVEHIDAATGDKTRLRTKGGNPQVVVERTPPKKRNQVALSRRSSRSGSSYAAEPGTDPSRNPIPSPVAIELGTESQPGAADQPDKPEDQAV